MRGSEKARERESERARERVNKTMVLQAKKETGSEILLWTDRKRAGEGQIALSFFSKGFLQKIYFLSLSFELSNKIDQE